MPSPPTTDRDETATDAVASRQRRHSAPEPQIADRPTPNADATRNDPPSPLGVADRHRRVTVALLAANLAFGNTPVLGLDLQGGVSVVLAPTEGASARRPAGHPGPHPRRARERGIAEPDVRVEGSNIVVDLPGVKDQREALDAVDVAGIVTLRPVFGCTAARRRVDTSTSVTGLRRRPWLVDAGQRHDVRSTSPRSTPTTAPSSTGDDHAATPAGFAGSAGGRRAAAVPPSTDRGPAGDHDRARRRPRPPSARRRRPPPRRHRPRCRRPPSRRPRPLPQLGGGSLPGRPGRRHRRGLQPRQRRRQLDPQRGWIVVRRPQRRW